MEMTEAWIKHPETMGADAVNHLPQLIEQYPYCATYRLLYLVALANTHSTRLREEVRRHAPTLPDRLQLFKLISNGEYEWVALMQQLNEQRRKKPESNDFELIDKFLDQLELGASAEAQYNLADMPDLQTERDEQDDLIDSFLAAEAEGQLFVPDATPQEPIDDDPKALEKIKDHAFLTESLAKVYVKQHKYEQALSIFSELNLKFSKKNSYFADQIRYLEKVIELTSTPTDNKKL